MPDDVSPSADPRSVDDVLTQMLMRQQAQQQMPFYQEDIFGRDPNRLPKQHTLGEAYYHNRKFGLDKHKSREVLRDYILAMNKKHPDVAETFNMPDVITPEQYEQYMAQVPGS